MQGKLILILSLIIAFSSFIGAQNYEAFDLSKLENRYFDLTNYQGGGVIFTGNYQGDRIVFSNTKDVHVMFDNARIESTHSEDAIAFLGDANDLIVSGKLRVNNAITFWGAMDTVEITGIRSVGAHTGIRATQDKAHVWVNIHENTFVKTKHEGVYIGKSSLGKTVSRYVRIHNNKFVETGWDAAQVGNCQYCMIEENIFLNAATANEPNQDWTITINPGSLAYMRNNIFIGCPNRSQCLDSRCFDF